MVDPDEMSGGSFSPFQTTPVKREQQANRSAIPKSRLSVPNVPARILDR